MRRLYLQIYLGFVGILVVVTLVSALLLRLVADPPRTATQLDGLVWLLEQQLPAADAPAAEQRRALERLARRLDVHAALWSAGGERIAAHGDALPEPRRAGPGRSVLRRRPPAWALRLDDGRWLALALPHRPGAHLAGLGWLLGVAGLLALGAYPLARRIARRLERVRAEVEAFGAGDLHARAPVEGRDEVAEVARSFNEAAAHVERLVAAQRRTLASASHELRSPLTRLRLALELLAGQPTHRLLAEAVADVDELDELVEDLLVTARLEARPDARRVDLRALAERECARAGVPLAAEPVELHGDPLALRRLLRNLLENARRHAAGSGVEVTLAARGDGALLRVADRGPGVPAPERERIFEPFYRPATHHEGRDGGVGLGLALVREIARAHGGDARCAPREGGGTVFEVELGAAPAQAA